jgi:hypothetical protein
MAASSDLSSNLDFVASQISNQKEKFNMKNIIIITGASSGFGALTARALASGLSACTSIRRRMARKWSIWFRTVSALSFFVGLVWATC